MKSSSKNNLHDKLDVELDISKQPFEINEVQLVVIRPELFLPRDCHKREPAKETFSSLPSPFTTNALVTRNSLLFALILNALELLFFFLSEGYGARIPTDADMGDGDEDPQSISCDSHASDSGASSDTVTELNRLFAVLSPVHSFQTSSFDDSSDDSLDAPDSDTDDDTRRVYEPASASEEIWVNGLTRSEVDALQQTVVASGGSSGLERANAVLLMPEMANTLPDLPSGPLFQS
ncbi:hypothetical protein Moror_17392 [Moniliophthora roreri MCA 2997]|uniref:Uncharacterized protein n=1 Tax=Moniliophthora roreri (strain MCA 2997) TaxID=1381753 RepID=V2XYW6_MONRO|nr:hypothetical protein Moror_17392 [Moniliophthora roreri MCA 2997]